MTDTTDTLPILPTDIDHLYYSFDECLTPVIKCIDDKLSEELDFVIRTQLKDFKEGLLGVQERAEARLKGGNAHQEEKFTPIVYVVEGIDGSGKTTLKRRLGEKYQGEEEIQGRTCVHDIARSTPPKRIRISDNKNIGTSDKVKYKDISLLRAEVFDRADEAAERAYYMVGNYVLADDMIEECKERKMRLVYIVDRYYSSTCSYTVAKATHIDIDQLDDRIFRWPDDLLKPEAVFILRVNESKRNDRVDKRLKETNLDSTSIERDESMKVLGSRVMEAFHKIRANNFDIDANPTEQEVEKSVWSHLMLSLTRLQWTRSRVRACVPLVPPFTIAIFGTHTSGKSTIGRLLAKVLGVDFLEELGDSNRTEENKSSVNAHKSREDLTWDDYLYDHENIRDKATIGSSRVVETWHIGNLAWALQRTISSLGDTSVDDCNDKLRGTLIERTVTSIREELLARDMRLLCVFLRSSVATMQRRRGSTDYKTSDLPMLDESVELPRLHKALDGRADELLNGHALFKPLHLNVLPVENNEDGDEAIDAVVDTIIQELVTSRLLVCA